jgi:2-amino-4-hydroxy-6-hydroxymethyldihydropteridine diphosphokinase
VTLACIGLGSNLGDSLAVMREARDALAARPGCRLRASSAIYRSGAVGPGEQPDYLNAALAIDTQLTAAALLDILLELEQRAGRVRGERWGPRTLDLDLLLYGDEHIDSSRLQVPHPRLFERNFVLQPLADILQPGWRFPDGSRIETRLATCPVNPLERTRLRWHAPDVEPAHE